VLPTFLARLSHGFTAPIVGRRAMEAEVILNACARDLAISTAARRRWRSSSPARCRRRRLARGNEKATAEAASPCRRSPGRLTPELPWRNVVRPIIKKKKKRGMTTPTTAAR
jgi:hypothetical protein